MHELGSEVQPPPLSDYPEHERTLWAKLRALLAELRLCRRRQQSPHQHDNWQTTKHSVPEPDHGFSSHFDLDLAPDSWIPGSGYRCGYFYRSDGRGVPNGQA
jgi:hypothetical protein